MEADVGFYVGCCAVAAGFAGWGRRGGWFGGGGPVVEKGVEVGELGALGGGCCFHVD